MPIRDKTLYADNWREISLAVRERAGNRCETCGVANYALGHRYEDGEFVWLKTGNSYSEARESAKIMNLFSPSLHIIVIVLTVHHKDFDPGNNDPDNLICLCQYHHNIADLAHRQRNARATRQARRAAGSLFPVEAQP